MASELRGAMSRPEGLVGSGILEVQRVRAELLNQIQEMQTVQETQIKNLDSRLSDLQRELKPRVQELERRNSASQRQLDDMRKKVQSLNTKEVAFLRRQYDELQMKFDRFASVDVPAQLKPVLDNLGQSQAKLASLAASTESSIARLRDQVKGLTERLASTAAKYQEEQRKCSAELDEMEGKLPALQSRLEQLSQLVADAPAASGSANLQKEIDRIESAILKIEEDVLPAEIQKAHAPFDQALAKLKAYAETQIQELQEKLQKLNEEHGDIDNRRKSADESLAANQNKASEVQSNFTTLKDAIDARLKKLEHDVPARLQELDRDITDFVRGGESTESSFKNDVEDEAGKLQTKILKSVDDLRRMVHDKTESNVREHEEALRRIDELQRTLDGNSGVVARIGQLERNVSQVLNDLHTVEGARADAAKQGATPGNVVSRLERLESRLLAAEARLGKVDGKTAGIAPVTFSRTPERIPEVPPRASEREAEAAAAG